MVKIFLFGDTHGRLNRIVDPLLDEKGVDLYIHLGDLCEDARELQLLTGKRILTVRGNNDFLERDVPLAYSLDREGHHIYISHGHKLGVHWSREQLAEAARKQGCDLAFFGHRHVFTDELVDGVRCISPGSPTWPRGDNQASYAIVYLDGDQVDLERRFV